MHRQCSYSIVEQAVGVGLCGFRRCSDSSNLVSSAHTLAITFGFRIAKGLVVTGILVGEVIGLGCCHTDFVKYS